MADSPINSYRSRQDLHDSILAAFASEPEVCEIHCFGRQADGAVDEYSDLDLIICSSDLAATQGKYLRVLSGISPIIGSYHIVCEQRELAQMIMLRDYSPYQKIDLSIAPDISGKMAFGPFTCLFRRDPPTPDTASILHFNGQREGLDNHLSDALFSIPRFTKCLFRRDRDMYRRWTGAVEGLAVLLFERHFGWSAGHRYRLMPHEHKALHKSLSDREMTRLDAIQPPDANPKLPESYQLAMEWTIDLYREKSAALRQSIDWSLAEHLRAFLSEEIERYRHDGPASPGE